MEEGREREDPLRLRQSTRKDGLQNDAADKADESKCLSNSSQQFGGVKIRSRPRAAVLRVQQCSECGTRQTGRHDQPWIDLAQQEISSRERHRQKWKGAP